MHCYCRKPAVHPALGCSPADRSCCRCRAEPLVHYRGTTVSRDRMLRWQSPSFASLRRGAVTSQITATHRRALQL